MTIGTNRGNNTSQPGVSKAETNTNEKMENIQDAGADIYANEDTIKDIRLDELESVIADKQQNDNEGFKLEYRVWNLVNNNFFVLYHSPFKHMC